MAIIALSILALLAYFILGNSYWVLGADADTYYLAAERLRDGGVLFEDTPSIHEHNFYRYSPWFAAAFMPLTLLPRELATAIFSAFSIVCAVAVLAAIARPIRLESIGLLVLIGPPLINFSFLGNVQAPLVAAMMFLPGRWVWVAVASSLKFTPLAFAIPDLITGRWRQGLACILLTALLILPTFAFDLTRYMTGTAGQVGTWVISPWLTVALVIIGSATTAFVSARSHLMGMLAASATTIVAAPYFIVAYLSWLAVPIRAAKSSPARPEVPARKVREFHSGPE